VYLDYIGIRVTHLARAVRFFEDGLGLEEVRRGKMYHGGVWVLLQDPISRQRLEINWYPPGSKYATVFSAGEGLDHIGVRVNDVAKVGRQLQAAGARRLEQYRDRGKVVVAFYEGPDGIWVELILSPSK
jgi:catechol 2,3-dioxygenase-like lactoylglutathione lyase family enzyme